VTYAISIISDIVGVITNIKTNYYYYGLGKSMSGAITKSFILIDYILASNLIVPTDPWIRYRYGAYHQPEPADCKPCDKAKLEANGESFGVCEAYRLRCVSNIDRELHTIAEAKKETTEEVQAVEDAADFEFDSLF